MKYRMFIIEHDDNTGAYKYYQDTDVNNDIMYADTVEEAKQEIDDIWAFDPSDV